MLVLLLLVGLLLLFLFIGVPVSIATLFSGIITFLINGISLETVSIRILNGIGKYELLAVPLFIVLGNLLHVSGLAEKLIGFAKSLVGHFRGGLPMVTVVTGMFLAEMSGAGTADAAVLSKIFIPSMAKAGYPRGFSAAVICGASSLAIIIPPSIPLIILGISANISISKLFLAAILPGMALVLLELFLSYFLSKRYNLPKSSHFSIKQVIGSLKESWFVLLIPLIILGSIFTGFATILESAELGLIVTLIGAIIYGKLNFKTIYQTIINSFNQTAVIMLIVSGSTLISWVFANEQVGEKVVDFISTLHLPDALIFLIVAFFLLVLGTFLHSTATIIIVGPMLVPLMNMLDISLLQYGVVLMLAQGVGQMTPPVATVLYTVSSTGEVPVKEILKYLLPFLLVYFAAMLLTMYIPFLTEFVPAHFGG